MHIPDGFLSTPVWATLDAAAVPAVAYLARSAGRGLDESRVPLLGVLGAFVFAAQMINFPVGPGTSGHLLGGTLLACVLGPAAASIVLTAVLAIQAFVFQDGGVLALGPNVINLAIAGVLAGYLPYALFGRGRLRWAAVFIGAMLSVLVSAALALTEIRISGVRVDPSIMAMSAGFFLIGAALEGAITVAVLRAIERMNPQWVRGPVVAPRKALIVLGVAAIAMAAAGFVIASSNPDSLERTAEYLGLAASEGASTAAPMPDYRVQSLSSEWLGKAAAGLAGLALVYTFCWMIGRFVAQRRSA